MEKFVVEINLTEMNLRIMWNITKEDNFKKFFRNILPY